MRKGKFIKTIFSVLCIGLLFLTAVNAEEATPTGGIYDLRIVYFAEVIDSGEVTALWVTGNSGFKTVEALKRWVQSLPPGTTLKLFSSCENFGVEPLVNSEEDMNDFKKFCQEHQINVIVNPSG